MARQPKLPASLSYLQPFASHLSRLPADSLNEDLDAEPLIGAIRSHFGQCTPESAAQFRSDVKLLEDWLRTTGGGEHPAHWICGFLATCELEDLFQDLPETKLPLVEMACPRGWKAQNSPGGLCVRKSGVIASFVAIPDKGAWDLLCHQWEIKRRSPPADPFAAVRTLQQLMSQAQGGQASPMPVVNLPRYEATDEYSDVTFGEVIGFRHRCIQKSPVAWKTVRYLLTVPGGQITGQVSRLKPGSFDEAPVEAVLSTLRVTAQV